MAAEYSDKYWSQRVGEYTAQTWSEGPTPFAELVKEYLPSSGRILELGAGAGQDGVWLASQGYDLCLTDATEAAFGHIRQRAQALDISNVVLQKLDITQAFPFPDNSFTAVYAQLVLHYFDDDTLTGITAEIERVLKPGGILATMVNSTKDPEYDGSRLRPDGRISVGGLLKRYFDKASYSPFVHNFEPLLFDEEGRTPKDAAAGTSGMVQFIGRKPGNVA